MGATSCETPLALSGQIKTCKLNRSKEPGLPHAWKRLLFQFDGDGSCPDRFGVLCGFWPTSECQLTAITWFRLLEMHVELHRVHHQCAAG
mmetsp:Transcript_110848/g.220481  ORF Transcript_110848/g.220481 Transcript_110848/m.220481 type:complete len:90 (+) Transcript_110848:235-504(+)